MPKFTPKVWGEFFLKIGNKFLKLYPSQCIQLLKLFSIVFEGEGSS
jgi:hypothetical protein